MTKLVAWWLAAAFLIQDDPEEKFRAVIAKIPLRRTDIADWKPSDVALKKKSALFPWLRIYELLKYRYPRSIIVDIREGTWAFAGEESSVRTIRESLPKWIAQAAIVVDTPERVRDIARFYVDFTAEPYSAEVGDLQISPEGEDWKAVCTLTQIVPEGCTAEPNKSKACSRKKIVHYTLTLGRTGALTPETKEEPSKGCVHGLKK